MLSKSAQMGGFEDAISAEGRPVKVSGTLVAEEPVAFDPEVDANSFSFWMQDRKGKRSQVVCFEDMPYDFEKSEEVVLTGSMKGDIFYATDLLVKCPSKYVDEELDKAVS